MLMDLLSQRNTPANPSPKGTTALLKILFAFFAANRPITGFASYRHTGRFSPPFGSCHGMFGCSFPMILTVLPLSLYFFFAINSSTCLCASSITSCQPGTRKHACRQNQEKSCSRQPCRQSFMPTGPHRRRMFPAGTPGNPKTAPYTSHSPRRTIHAYIAYRRHKENPHALRLFLLLSPPCA